METLVCLLIDFIYAVSRVSTKVLTINNKYNIECHFIVMIIVAKLHSLKLPTFKCV